MAVGLGAFLAALGGALQGGAVTLAMLITGRFIAGFAVGLMSATIPNYCVSRLSNGFQMIQFS
jgi:Sugar (and other) transporter